MKLNLLPTSVSRGKKIRVAILLAVLFAGSGIGAAAFMMVTSKAALAAEKARVERLKPEAAKVVARSKEADTIVAQVALVNLNISLAQAMSRGNETYPKLYEEVRRYIPSFFRINSLSATPAGAESCTVTMNGVIQSYRQYNDLMMALLRIPGARSVSRSGYALTYTYVPGLNREDQTGRPIRVGGQRLPDNAVDRLDILIQQGRQGEEPSSGGFGQIGVDGPINRTAMPGYQNLTVAVVLPRNITTVDPRATIASAATLAGRSGGGAAGGGRTASNQRGGN